MENICIINYNKRNFLTNKGDKFFEKNAGLIYNGTILTC